MESKDLQSKMACGDEGSNDGEDNNQKKTKPINKDSSIVPKTRPRLFHQIYHEYTIESEWDGTPYTQESPVRIQISGYYNQVRMQVDAPFYNDPAPPNGKRGQPYPKLYDYEVVEVFFLNDDDQYLEVELSPHGEHLVLLLNGRRNNVVQQLPLRYNVGINGQTWRGTACILKDYFPCRVTKFNAFAIHGEGADRKYLALYPTPKGKYEQPDFHRLEYFRPIDMSILYPFMKSDSGPSDSEPSDSESSCLWHFFPPQKH